MSKQTAVEWIQQQVKQQGITHYFSLREILEQAKEMEKQQIIDAYDASQTKCVNTANNVLKMLRKESVFEINATESEQYYNETYKPSA
jgi:hypothetical protein